ncbi:MAG: nuclear transport factor 2 family protein [Sulfuriferula sp.]
MKYLILLLWSGIIIANTSYAAEYLPRNIPTVTRLVLIFSQLEAELDAATQHGDTETIDKLLAPTFEMRVGAMPGNPVPRAAWLQQLHVAPGAALSPTQMAVHDYDTVAIVSYLSKRTLPAGDIYIVDVWKKKELTWQLAVRYASPAGRTDFAIPGAVLDTPQLDKRY